MEDRTPLKYSAQQFLEALALVGRLLEERGASFEVIVIGGANLAIQRIVERLTVDVDIVAVRSSSLSEFECAKPLPSELEEVVADVAAIKQLPVRWMNGAASSDFALGLPDGFDRRLNTVELGGLTVSFADRSDIVAWKLQAAVDNLGINNRHLDDLRKMQPAPEEVAMARRWFETVEAHQSGFWQNLETILEELRRHE